MFKKFSEEMPLPYQLIACPNPYGKNKYSYIAFFYPECITEFNLTEWKCFSECEDGEFSDAILQATNLTDIAESEKTLLKEKLNSGRDLLRYMTMGINNNPEATKLEKMVITWQFRKHFERTTSLPIESQGIVTAKLLYSLIQDELKNQPERE